MLTASIMTRDRSGFKTTRGIGLKLAVHCEAFWIAPHAYLAAAWWRLRRKRVRARARLAPLLAASRHAYALWLLSEETAGPGYDAASPAPPIIALIQGSENTPGLNDTLHGLSGQGIEAFVTGTSEAPMLTAVVERIGASAGACWVMPLAAGDVLGPMAAAAYRSAAAQSDAAIIYADDDLLDAGGKRTVPHFKPQWNSELFRYFDYLTGACIVRVQADDFADLSRPDWAQALVTRGTETHPPHHIPRVLHHRRVRPKPRALPSATPSETLPSVTVIVPTRNQVGFLATCLQGLTRTDYPDLEVIIVDNGSDDPATLAYLAELDSGRYRIIRRPGPFNFSELNNRAVAEARGHLLCLLNNDIEVIAPDWLQIMAAQALRDDVGAVGARLLYPDGRIQHAGVVLGVGGGAAHAHRLMDPGGEGYFRRHALPQFVSAVTAACLVVRRERFLAVGGFDEANFAVAFNDVDLCLRLNQRGWQSLYEPRATLIHHESVSRGFDRDRAGAARLARELTALKRLWSTDTKVDPFHHDQLSPFTERFVVRL